MNTERKPYLTVGGLQQKKKMSGRRKTNFYVIEFLKKCSIFTIDDHVIITLRLISDGAVWSRNISSTWEITPLVNYSKKRGRDGKGRGRRAHTASALNS